jgi:hypothetical protein
MSDNENKESMMGVSFELPEDRIGRLFRIADRADSDWCEQDYPCRYCPFGVFDVDRFCCKKLPHEWNEFDEFHGEPANPSRQVEDAAKLALGRSVDWGTETIEFYDCKGRNS